MSARVPFLLVLYPLSRLRDLPRLDDAIVARDRNSQANAVNVPSSVVWQSQGPEKSVRSTGHQ